MKLTLNIWRQAAADDQGAMHTYQVDDDGAKLPAGWEMPAAAVTVDSQDRVYCFNRSPEHPVVVFDREGKYLHHWGAGLFAFAG